ncbi:ABC transporter permease subunit [Halorhabdus sp. BNX81]|uniref:ABC transporter permease n=1 Tax=Halorhabdus sp. BNX81 TaxID=2980181 RepID=UPI0023DD1077|nr:ABC transporter permease subunit [Halorhabdus sp. BNX81]WEL21522.1 ABC-type spermidine/putrescine transport system,permease component [Halorhabdus sp. BNX81]
MTAPDETGIVTGTVPDRTPGRLGRLSARYGRTVITALLFATVAFLIGPVLITVVGSFFENWTGILPSGGLTLDNWAQALGIAGGDLGAQRGMGGFWTFVAPDILFVLQLPVVPDLTVHFPFDFAVQTPIPMALGLSVLLALAGVCINLLVGVPIAYAVTRYEFTGRRWMNTFAVLPIVPGIILGIAFLKTYPNLPSIIALVLGYSLLKIPYMVLAVQSAFESMDLRSMEESARSLGASWTTTFLRVIVPGAKQGIISGSIICWTLAAAEFNFSYVIYASGPRPFSLFLFENISNNPFLRAAAAISIYFVIVAAVTALLNYVGENGFSVGGVQ